MFSLYQSLSLRYFRQFWLRTLLVVLSIAVGVATLVGSTLLNRSMIQATRSAATPLAGPANLHVSNGDAGVQLDLIQELQQVRGVHRVEPLLVKRVLLPDLQNRRASLLGIEQQAASGRDNPYGVQITITNPGAFLSGRRPVLVGKELATDLRAAGGGDGNAMRILVGGRLHELAIAGTVQADREPAASLTRTILVMEINQAAALLGRPGIVSRLDLFLEPEADPATVRGEIETVLAGRAMLDTTESHGQSIQDAISAINIGLLISGWGALIVGLFLVYNAMSVSVAERRHQIGILRSVGATRGQIAGLFIGEAGILGLAGAVLGLPFGVGMAQLMLGPVQRVMTEIFIDAGGQRAELTAGTALLALVAGVATAVLAALVPSLRAAFDQPADAVRRAPPVRSLILHSLLIGSCILLVGLGASSILLRAYLPGRLGSYGGIVLIFIGLLLSTQPLALVVARLLQPVARRFLPVEARLSADNLVRSPGRTGLVIAALAAAVALVFQTAGIIRSNEEPILEWIDHTITADLFVTCGGPASAGNQNVPLDEGFGPELEALPGVRRAVPIRFRRVHFRDGIVLIIAVDSARYHEMNQARQAVPSIQHYPSLREPGTVLVSENFAALHGVKVNDWIQVRGPGGPVDLRVVGTLVDHSWNRGSIIMDRSNYRDRFADPLVDVFDVYTDPEIPPREVQRTVSDWGARQGVIVIDRDDLRQDIVGIIRRLYGIAYAQEALVGVVAALGVLMALLISVLQRQREIGLLRAVGATRAQILRTVLAEAALMGIIGTALGFLFGLPLEWYAVRIIILEETGFVFPMRIPWLATGGIALFTIGIATFAGILPALHAVRLRIAEAIAYE